jgi:small subunit ribosomal protein S8
MVKKSTVLIPNTNLTREIAQILEQEGFIQSFQILEDKRYISVRLKYRSKQIITGKIKQSCITNLKRMSKPGLRIYTNHKEIPRILGGAGIVIVSTPAGIMTDRQARALGIGGEILCSIW